MQRLVRLRNRVRFIRLLKKGTAKTLQQAGVLVGLKLFQFQLLWKQYRSQEQQFLI